MVWYRQAALYYPSQRLLEPTLTRISLAILQILTFPHPIPVYAFGFDGHATREPFYGFHWNLAMAKLTGFIVFCGM